MIKIAALSSQLPKLFKYQSAPIPSSGLYYFTTDSGIDYEVRFGRKQADILAVNIVFGVLNEEYEGEEYVLTNKGEFYSVMHTIEAIIKDFEEKNPNVHNFEFAGEPRGDEQSEQQPTKRTKIYLKYASRIFPSDRWKINMVGNKVSIERIK